MNGPDHYFSYAPVSYMKHSPTVEGAVITDDKLNQKMN
jgi:hypothetical protein